MKWKTLATAALFSGLFCGVVQGQRPIHFAVGGGVAIPAGHFDDNYAPGGNVLGGVIIGGPDALVGLRLDYSANTFRGRTVGGTHYRNTTVPAVVGSLVGALPVGMAKPYLILGAGWYPYREATDTKRGNDFGVAGGAGISFPFFLGAGFVEGRYHSVFGRTTARHFVPVTFGLLL